jgi:hypothetical protein
MMTTATRRPATTARWTATRDLVKKNSLRRTRGRAYAARVRASAPEPPTVRRDIVARRRETLWMARV